MTLGESRFTPIHAIPGAAEHDVRIHIYSKWGGRKEIKLAADTLYQVLHNQSFPIEGHRVVTCRSVFADMLRTVAPDTQVATVRYRVVTESMGNG